MNNKDEEFQVGERIKVYDNGNEFFGVIEMFHPTNDRQVYFVTDEGASIFIHKKQCYRIEQ